MTKPAGNTQTDGSGMKAVTTVHKTFQLRGYTSRAGYARIDEVLAHCATLYNGALENWKDGHRRAWSTVPAKAGQQGLLWDGREWTKAEREGEGVFFNRTGDPLPSSPHNTSLYAQMRELTGIRGDDRDVWGELHIQVSRGVLKRFDKARQAFFRRLKAGEKSGFPRFRSRRRWRTIEILEPSPGMIRGRYVHVKGLPRIEIQSKRQLPASKSLRVVTITRQGRWLTVNLTYEIEGPVALAPGTCPENSITHGDTSYAAARGGPTCDGGDRCTTWRNWPALGGPARDGGDRADPEGHPVTRGAPTCDGGDPEKGNGLPHRTGGPTCDGGDRVGATGNTCQAVGLDFGVTDRITLSTGEAIPRRDAGRQRIEEAQRRLSRCRKGSQEWRKRAQVLANLHSRAKVSHRNECHRITTGIVRRFDLVAIEDLTNRNMTASAAGTAENPGRNVAAKSGLNRSILEQGWGIIRNQLVYKVEWAGKQLVEVDPRRTSQTCSGCGAVGPDSRRGKTYVCRQCGLSIDADINAARNILKRAVSSPVGTTPENPTVV